MGSNLSPASFCTTSFCLGLRSKWILFLSSSPAVSITIGKRMSCTGAGYLTGGDMAELQCQVPGEELTAIYSQNQQETVTGKRYNLPTRDSAPIRQYSSGGVNPAELGSLDLCHSAAVGIQVSYWHQGAGQWPQRQAQAGQGPHRQAQAGQHLCNNMELELGPQVRAPRLGVTQGHVTFDRLPRD